MITVIGAGPVGSHAARLLAEAGNEVRVLEEHSAIGRPVQCTGIVTKRLGEIVRLRNEFVLNRLNKVRLHAPNGEQTEIRINDIVIDRTAFDRHVTEKARKKGARLVLNSKVSGIRTAGRGFKLKISDSPGRKERVERSDILVGADGPNSIVSAHIGNKKPRVWVGVQAVVRMPVDKKTYSVYFGDQFPGFFGWVVPQSDSIARVGIAAERNPRHVFSKFIKRFEKCKVLEMQGGLIPRYRQSITVNKGNAYIVGDAAAQVKATTGGGLVPGMKAAESLARSINNGTSYKRELARVEKELRMSLLLRNILDRFNEKDYNELVSIAGREKVRNILNKEDRDRPSRIVYKSITKEPRILLFARTLFRAKRL